MTIYDIAKLAGVSASTVSRVANNKPGIKEETRKQILELLEAYDYRPNETARGLVTKASRMIGILMPTSSIPITFILPIIFRRRWKSRAMSAFF